MKSEYHGHLTQWKELLQKGLQEDGWQWDWTTLGTVGAARGKKVLEASVIAKSEGVWAAESLIFALDQVAVEMGTPGFVLKSFEDGKKFKKGDVLCGWRGPAPLVLALERPFLNLASYVGGIATHTHELVSKVRKTCPVRTPRVTSTRKTLPGYRDVGVLGVLAGGGLSHRVSLSGGVLIKENHIAAAGGVSKAIQGVRAIAPHGLKIEIEVRSLKELAQALDAHADGVLLDNFTPKLVRDALKLINQNHAKPVVEVSGGINTVTISDYAIQGVDVISVGSLTHSVRACDFSLLVKGVSKV